MIEWIDDSWLAHTMRDLQWAFPASEALHFIGLCLLIGSVAIMDLRLLGFARGMPIQTVHRLIPWAWVGFGINLTTGILFFFAQPNFYVPNMAFRIKLILILFAGANALWFQLSANRELAALDPGDDAPAKIKAMAGLSLALWIGVICFGRFIMYWPPY